MKINKKRRTALKSMGAFLTVSMFGANLNANELNIESKKRLLVLVGKDKENFLNGLNKAKTCDKTIKEVDFIKDFVTNKDELKYELKNSDILNIVGILDYANFVLLEQALKETNYQFAMQIFHNSNGNEITHLVNSKGLSKSFFNITADMLKNEDWPFMIGYAFGSGNFNKNFSKNSNMIKIQNNAKKDIKLVSFLINKKEIKNV